MHRLMMTSSAIASQSTVTPEQERLDPENDLYSRLPLRRLERRSRARQRCWPSPGGWSIVRSESPIRSACAKDGLVTSQEVDGGWRRSIYVMQRRKEDADILETFDLPQMNPNCIERPDSTVAAAGAASC